MHSRRFYIGLFLLACSTLMLEIIQTRLLSVVAWYHLAFFVISAAMFGMSAGAVWVYLRAANADASNLPRALARYSGLQALTTAVCLVGQLTLNPEEPVLSVSGIALYVILSLLIAIPFIFAGAAVSLALTRSPFPIGRVYAVDLIGAGTGCLGVLALLGIMDAPSAILLCAAVSALASVFFGRAGARADVANGTTRGRGGSGAIAMTLALALCSVVNCATARGVQPLFVKGARETPQSYAMQKWNSFSRIAVGKVEAVNTTDPRSPGYQRLGLWGPSPTLVTQTLPPVEKVSMNIDGLAGATMYRYEGDPAKVRFLQYDVTNLAYFIRARGHSAVIGIGGGRDILSASIFGVGNVVGIDVNPIFVNLLTRDPHYSAFCRVASLPGVRLVVDDGRSWFAGSAEKFDLIQMSLIDTWAATGAGAFSLSENGLYTVEAWTMFLDHLNDGGVFTVSRWFGPGEVNETGRTVSLAVAALLRRGATPVRDHLFVASCGRIATVLVAPSPLTAEDVGALRTVCRDMEYHVLVAPDQRPESRVLDGIVSAADAAGLREFTSGLDLNLTPTTDDSPFFFNLLPIGSPLKMFRVIREKMETGGVVAGNLKASTTLLAILGVSALLVLVTIVLPLLSAARGLDVRFVTGGTGYFGLLGLGFMFVEIGLLQRLSLFLGHPVYSLSVVLFSLILATGVGSYLSGGVPLRSPGRFVIWAVVLGVGLLVMPRWLAPLTAACEHWAIVPKALLSVAVIAPAGLLMGFGFPTGMRLAEARSAAPTPWFWGINGATGVLASALAVIASIAFGVSTTIAIGGVAYLALIPFALLIGFRQAGAGTARVRL